MLTSHLQPVTVLPPLTKYPASLLQGVFALNFLLLMIYFSIRLIALANLKKIYKPLLALFVLFILVNIIPSAMPNPLEHSNSELSNIEILPSFNYPTTPIGNPPQEVVWFVLIGFILGLRLIVIALLKRHLYSAQVEENWCKKWKT